ncbi:MAG TPA: hypothetical protein HA326_02375 [Thermoplasmata archaeon]|nr:hypothetical protein [Thermoplasmata archaeon]
MSVERDDFLLLQRLVPEDHGLTAFDADTQETSYGTLVVDGMPLIFDTHRKDAWFVSTVEILTETIAPAAVTPEEVARFAKVAEHAGIQTLPYSACFFKGNLHVYAYYGPVRGFDLAAVAADVPGAERKLDARVRSLWAEIPRGIVDAQRELLSGKRKARHPADLEVLAKRLDSSGGGSRRP